MSSIASAMREAPPVSATMPSAPRLSTISSLGTRQMNQRKPSPTSRRAAKPAATVDQPSRRQSRCAPKGRAARRSSPPAPSSVLDPIIGISSSTRRNYSLNFGAVVALRLTNGFDGLHNGMTRGGGGHAGDQDDLRQHREIARHPDRKITEQGRHMVAAGLR